MPAISFLPQLNIDGFIVLVTALIVTVIIKFIPMLSRPFHLLFTMIHELGHVFAVRLSNGTVRGFWVFFDTSGVTDYSETENLAFAAAAGYLGTALFSAGLIMMSGFPYIAPYTLGTLGGFLLLLTFLYGKQAAYKKNDKRTPVTKIVGMAFAVILIGVAWTAHLVWSVFLLDLLAFQGTFNVLRSFRELVQQVRQNQKDIDPEIMAGLKRGSAMFWTKLWSLSSFLILGSAIWFTWLRGLSG
jgi:hypothetical protein